MCKVNNVKERCNCGDTGSTFHPDENQYEANCWDCYYQAMSVTQALIDAHQADTDHQHSSKLIHEEWELQAQQDEWQRDLMEQEQLCDDSSDDLPF